MIFKSLVDEKIYHLVNTETNFDVIRKEIVNEKTYIIYYLNSLVDSQLLNLIFYRLSNDNKSSLENKVLGSKLIDVFDIELIFNNLSSGVTLILEGEKIYLVETRNYPSRGIDEPVTEKTIRGSKDGFNENIINNLALIRRRIKNPSFRCPLYKIGNKSKVDVVITYLDDVVDKENLNNLIKKINNAEINDLVMSDRAFEEKVFKQYFNPFPLVKYSERPDIIASYLLKGYIAILVDTSSSVIITPTSIFEHTKHVEEYRQVPLVGTFIRLLRYLAIFLSIFLVPLWMMALENAANTNYLIIKPLEPSPISLLIQILIVELMVEIVRIATIHTPNQLSSAIGLIATLILGQMAVEIGVFQQEVLLFCSLSIIGGFATPSYELSLANKLIKIMLIILVGLLQASGFIIGISLLILLLSSIKVLKTPYLYPLLPFNRKELFRVLFRSSTS